MASIVSLDFHFVIFLDKIHNEVIAVGHMVFVTEQICQFTIITTDPILFIVRLLFHLVIFLT